MSGLVSQSCGDFTSAPGSCPTNKLLVEPADKGERGAGEVPFLPLHRWQVQCHEYPRHFYLYGEVD